MNPILITESDAEAALDALVIRVRWYEVRGFHVPAATAAAFNTLADALNKPTTPPWNRIS